MTIKCEKLGHGEYAINHGESTYRTTSKVTNLVEIDDAVYGTTYQGAIVTMRNGEIELGTTVWKRDFPEMETKDAIRAYVAAQTAEPVAEEAESVEPTLCECGCGVFVTGKNSKFRPGHDARLKSELLKRFDEGPVDDQVAAMHELTRRGWRTPDQLRVRADAISDARSKKAEKILRRVAWLEVKIADYRDELNRLDAELAALDSRG